MKNRRSTPLLLAAAAIAAPALLTACGTEPTTKSESPAAGPSTTTAAPTAPTTDPTDGGGTVERLLTDADTVYTPGEADWFTINTDADAGDLLFMPCAMTGLSDTGATSVVSRDFELRGLDADAPAVEGDLLVQMVAEYDDEAAATQAWSTVNGWLTKCKGRPDDIQQYRALQTRKVVVPGADAVITDAHYGPVPVELDPTGDSAYIMEAGVLRQGNRLTVLTSVVVGQDYNFTDGTPVEQMLVPAAERLQG